MWQRIALLSLIPLFTAGGATYSQQVNQPRTLSPLRQWIRIEVVLGRVTIQPVSRRSYNLSAQDQKLDQTEKLSISHASGDCTFAYESRSPGQQLNVTYCGRKRLEIVRQNEPQSETAYLRYLQEPDQPVLLVLGNGETGQEYRADSLWHLMLDEPEICNRQLLPILHQLRGGWTLVGHGEHVVQELLRLSKQNASPRDRWNRLIGQLGSRRFSERQAADRQLRRGGLSLLYHLQRLDASKLTAEQRLRIENIKQVLTAKHGDTPQRIAAWMIDDPNAWLALLAHDSLACRQTAVAQLTRIHGRRIDFNPAVSAAVRQAEIERLRRQIAAGD